MNESKVISQWPTLTAHARTRPANAIPSIQATLLKVSFERYTVASFVVRLFRPTTYPTTYRSSVCQGGFRGVALSGTSEVVFPARDHAASQAIADYV